MSKAFEFANNHSNANVFASKLIGLISLKMESCKCANTKASQFEIIVQYMTSHPDLSKGYLKTPGARRKSSHLWANLCKDLNAEGPPQRDCCGWEKVWADFKNHTQGKLRKNKINLSGTGGGPSKHCSLTPLEEKVSELLDLGKAVDGMTEALNFGLKNKSNANLTEIVDEELVDNDDFGDTYTPDAWASHVENDITRNDVMTTDKENDMVPEPRMTPRKIQTFLLEKQVDNQITFQKNSYDLMNNMNENLKGILRLRKEKFKFKTQKFEFMKQNLIQKTKNAVARLEVIKEILRLRQEFNPPS